MSLKLDLFTAIALLGFELPADAHDIYSPLRDRLGNSCCHEGDCRPAPYRVTPTGVQMFVEGEWIAVPDFTIQYRRSLVTRVKQTGDIGAGRYRTVRATGWTMQPTAPSYHRTRQQFLDRSLPFVRGPSDPSHEEACPSDGERADHPTRPTKPAAR
jgi:hypothetical protein